MRRGTSNLFADTHSDCNCTHHVWPDCKCWPPGPQPFHKLFFLSAATVSNSFSSRGRFLLLSSSGQGQVSDPHSVAPSAAKSVDTFWAPWTGGDLSSLWPPFTPLTHVSTTVSLTRRMEEDLSGLDCSWCSVILRCCCPWNQLQSTQDLLGLPEACWDRVVRPWSSSLSLGAVP